jgi:predicted PurR-regulated permease PerM
MQKKRPSKSQIGNYVFWAIIAVLIIISYFIIKPYLIALISAFVLAYLVRPLHKYLLPKIGNRASALACVFLIIFAVVVPIALIGGTIISQAYEFDANTLANSLLENLSSLRLLEKFNINLEEAKTALFSNFVGLLKSTLLYIPSLIISTFILILAIYYSLANWSFLSEKLEDLIPLSNKKKIAEDIAKSTNSIIYGYVLIAFIEFLVSFVGFFLSGVQYYVLFPTLIALCAFIPAVGPGLVWVLVAAFYFATGQYAIAIGVVITGLIISIFIENFVFAQVVGRQAKIHPLIVLIGVFGGVPLFGIFGFIIGPLLLVYTINLIENAVKGK